VSNTIAVVYGITSTLGTLLLGAVATLTGHIGQIHLLLNSVTIWDALAGIAPLLAPLLVLALTAVGKVVWNHEKRLRNVEKGKTRHGRSLYGDERDQSQPGLSAKVNRLDERVTKMEGEVSEILEHVRDMNGYDEDN
jgi:hypothetical protein